MGKHNKKEQTQIDIDLQDLYNRASKTKITCPHCNKDHDGPPDFSEMARAMELRIKYENIKQRGGGGGLPDFFKDTED